MDQNEKVVGESDILCRIMAYFIVKKVQRSEVGQMRRGGNIFSSFGTNQVVAQLKAGHIFKKFKTRDMTGFWDWYVSCETL